MKGRLMQRAIRIGRAALARFPRTHETRMGAHGVLTARIVTTGSLDVHVYSVGGPRTAPNAPVFVLLHGIGMSHRYYRRLQQILAGHGDVHSLDLPGFGAAAKPDRQISVAEYAAVVSGTLDKLGTGAVVVVGHSMGTQFAAELALLRPDLVSHVVLIGPVVDSARRNVLIQALLLGVNSLTESPAGNAIVFTDYVRSGVRWYLTELPVMMSYDLEKKLSRIAQPVLVVRGSRDPVAPRSWCQKLAAIAAHGRFLEIPGKPHIVHHGAAARTAADILAFTLT